MTIFSSIDETKSDTTTTTTTVTAEQSIQSLLDRRDLYAASTKHEKRLLRCVRHLSDFIAKRQGIVESHAFWPKFRQWSLNNSDLTNSYANAFMSRYLSTKGHQASAFRTVRLSFRVGKSGASTSLTPSSGKSKCSKKKNGSKKKITRLNKLQQTKATQFEAIKARWEAMVQYMSTVTPEEIRQHLRAVANNRKIHAGVAVSSFNEMAVRSTSCGRA